MKKILLFPCLLLAFALGGCTNALDEGDMTIELACPQPKTAIKGNLVTVTWPAIAKTAGYAYRFDQGDYTELEADKLSFTQKVPAGEHTFEIYAMGNNTHTTNSAVRKLNIVIDVKLPKPEPVATTNKAMATITWEALDRAVGYAYTIDDKPEVKVEATVLTYTGKFTPGEHTFSLRALGDGLDSSDSDAKATTFTIDLTLPTPAITIELTGTEATLTWKAIEGASGYVYKIDNGAEVTVAANVLTYKETFTGGKHTFVLQAKGDGVNATDSKKNTFEFAIVDTSVGVFIKKSSGAIVEIEESTTKGIFSKSVDCTATDSFTVLIDDVEHGFASYSGNGGVGTVNSALAALPFYNGYTYYVREAVGQLTKTGTLNALYTNLAAPGKLLIKIDCANADKTPRYYLKLDTTPDASIILEQYFDLMVFGGDWTQSGKAGKGTKAPSGTLDGTEAGTAQGASYTTTGNMLSETSASYIANRGMTGWSVSDFVYEFPNFIRLSNSSNATQYGILTTPRLTALSSATSLTVTFDGLRFASDGNISVKVLGAGTITSASAVKDGAGNPISITPLSGNASFLITLDHGSKHDNDDAKPFSNFTFTVQGATADTQISWDATTATTSSAGRYCLDNIVIRKN